MSGAQEVARTEYDRDLIAATNEWLFTTVESLVDSELDVSLTEKDTAGGVVFIVNVAPDDLGKVIGVSGRTARAIRTLLCCRSAKDGIQYGIDIPSTAVTA